MVQMMVPSPDGSWASELHAVGKLKLIFSDEGVDDVRDLSVHLDIGNLDIWEVKVVLRVYWESLFVFLEDVVNESVESVENWVSKTGGSICHNTGRFLESTIRVMDVGHHDVSPVVQVAIKLPVLGIVAGLQEIAEDVGSMLLIQDDIMSFRVDDAAKMDGFQDTFSPPLHVLDIDES